MPEKSDKHESRRICENVLARVHSGITREATLSEGRKGWPTGRPDESQIHLRKNSHSHTLGRRVSDGPLTPLGIEIGLDEGKNSASSYPSIEVVPAESELLCKRRVRQGVGYVRTQGYCTPKHYATFPTELRRNVSAEESSQVCSRGTGGEERNEAECQCAVYI